MKVKLVTDASCSIPKEKLEEMGIAYLESVVIIEDQSYRELTELERNEFIASLPLRSPYPTTSQASVEDVVNILETAIKEGYTHVLYIGVTPQISAQLNSVRLASKKYKDKINITIYPSDLACGSQGAMTYYAWKLLSKGKSIEEIVAYLDEIKPKIYTMSIGANFEAVFKSGKVKKSPALSALAFTFKLKPIGELLPDKGFVAIGAGLGFGKAIKKMMGVLKKTADPSITYNLFIADALNVDLMKKIEVEVKKVVNIQDTHYWELSNVTAVSSGLGNVMFTIAPVMKE